MAAHWRICGGGIILLLILSGCSILPVGQGDQAQAGTPTSQPAVSNNLSQTDTAETNIALITPEVTADLLQPAEATLLRIWLPPEFDPEGSSPASQMLKGRLEQFVAENPEVRLEVRVKALDGEGGMVDTLVAANAAAPLALPDLVLISRQVLESAALKGLLYPYDGLTALMDDPGWFEYALEQSRLKSNTYGIPFAGEALVLAFHPSLFEVQSYNLEDFPGFGQVLLFPAADLQALYTLCQYLALGGNLQDAAGRPWLDQDILITILDFYQRASLAGVMPYWLTQFSNDEQVWEAFMGGEYPMAVTQASQFLKRLQSEVDDLAMAPVPILDNVPFTLASGWSWALAGQESEKRSLSVRLVEFLVEPEFLAEWTYAAGYLPPRMDALEYWQNDDLRQVLKQISSSAQLMPSMDIISSLGPPLEQAVVDVLKAQKDPQTAAQEAVDQVNQP
jgi:ABC-type glycerol-3-phosphate transport system substrate-binding protein